MSYSLDHCMIRNKIGMDLLINFPFEFAPIIISPYYSPIVAFCGIVKLINMSAYCPFFKFFNSLEFI